MVIREEPVKDYLLMGAIFDIIEFSYIAVGNCSRDPLNVETSRKCANITT